MKKINLIILSALSISIFASCAMSQKPVDPYKKTDFVTVIPKDKTVTVPDGKNLTHIDDVFWENRTITLSGYSIGKYEVTQALYKHVMGSVPFTDEENRYGKEVQDLRPVAGVNFYEAAVFCNKLSELENLEPVFTIENIKKNKQGIIISASVTWDLSKKGYRLPTEAEWEFASRGAGKTAEDWSYTYSGSNNAKKTAWTMMTSSGPDDDDETMRSHEVGLKTPNALGIYDMSGNVAEICMDWYRSVTENNDFSHANAVNDSGEVTNPVMLKGRYDNHVIRGGSYRDSPGTCSNKQRMSTPTYGKYYVDGTMTEGFRLARSL